MAKASKKSSSPSLIMIILMVAFLALMLEFKAVSCRRSTRIDMDCANGISSNCHHVEDQDYEGDDQSGGGDYDYYRRYGDVPSPGIGH
ncbi:hypothetical protein M5689_002322 [Euphorbia peplus]|nr:hypothetical protein M5689_002322 [Euphorbia peplus]